MYFNLIKKGNNLNQQIMVQTRFENRRKGRSLMSYADKSENMSNVALKEEASSDTSDEEGEDQNCSNLKKAQA